MTVPPALIDTNILCYAFETGELEKRAVAAELLSRCWRSEIALAVSVQNLAEFFCCYDGKNQTPGAGCSCYAVYQGYRYVRWLDGDRL